MYPPSGYAGYDALPGHPGLHGHPEYGQPSGGYAGGYGQAGYSPADEALNKEQEEKIRRDDEAEQRVADEDAHRRVLAVTF